MIKISTSIVSVSVLEIADVIRELEVAGADMIHFDIEDGVFVPVMNLGPNLIKDLRPITRLPFDVHLMMENPEWIIPIIADYGANNLSVHFEACPYPRRVLKKIHEHGMRAGLAFNPKTEIPDLNFCLPYLSFIVLLTTEPEDISGEYLPSVLEKLRMNKDKYPSLDWVVDGAVNRNNIKEITQSGAAMVVSGRAVFENYAIQKNIKELRKNAYSDEVLQ